MITMGAWWPTISLLIALSASGYAQSLYDKLDSFQFLHKGVLESTMDFEFRPMCSSYVEGLTQWSVGPVWEYPFQSINNGSRFVTPPLGIRSAVPLGGFGTGTFELRADGTFREWDIINNTPDSANKLEVMENMMFGIRVEDSTTNTISSSPLQINPSSNFVSTIESIEYSGAYPVSKLRFSDNSHRKGVHGVNVDLYAYSNFKLYNPEQSAIPSVAFSFNLQNTLDHEVTTSLLFNLPNVFPEVEPTVYMNDTLIDGIEYLSYKLKASQSAWKQCNELCMNDIYCVAWNIIMDKPIAPRGSAYCSLMWYNFGDIVAQNTSVYAYSGVRPYTAGVWSTDGASLTVARLTEDNLSGNATIRTAVENFHGTTSEPYFMTSDNVEQIWRAFSSSGTLSRSTVTGDANYGAVAINTTLPAGANATVTFVFAWYFPNRKYVNESLGNFYNTLYPSSVAVSEDVANRLHEFVDNALEWHQTATDNSLPDILRDALVNSVSTMMKTGMWFADGRWRQYESFSCSDVDPTHIHFYRSIPYAVFFPSLTKQLLQAYAKFITPQGQIQEFLAAWGYISQMDVPGGRNIGDANTVFVLDAYQIMLQTNDMQFLNGIYPTIKKAVMWQIQRSANYSLPGHLLCTYDWFGFDQKDVCAYNAFLHLAHLKAAKQLAILSKDSAFAALCDKWILIGQAALNDLLWNGEYFRAWFDVKDNADALHTDTMYGQLWAYILNLGDLVGFNGTYKMQSHLTAELTHSGTPWGIQVMWNDPDSTLLVPERLTAHQRNHAVKSEADDQKQNTKCKGFRDNLIWEGGSIDWSALSIFLENDVESSLGPALSILRKYRDNLADFWDFKDLSAADGTGWEGYPWCNSHYARQVIMWSIPLAVSGQYYNAMESTLSFKPKMMPEPSATSPVKLPFFTYQASGVLMVHPTSSPSRYELQVHAGNLNVEKVIVHGKCDGGDGGWCPVATVEKVTVQKGTSIKF